MAYQACAAAWKLHRFRASVTTQQHGMHPYQAATCFPRASPASQRLPACNSGACPWRWLLHVLHGALCVPCVRLTLSSERALKPRNMRCPRPWTAKRVSTERVGPHRRAA